MEALQDLHNVQHAEMHAATVGTAKIDEEDSRQMNKDGNSILQLAQSPPILSMDVPSIGTLSTCPRSGL